MSDFKMPFNETGTAFEYLRELQEGMLNHTRRPIYKTGVYLITDGEWAGWMVMNHHDDVVVAAHPDGTVRLSGGKYRRESTRDRINRTLPHGWHVGNSNGEWVLYGPDASRVPFEDNITLEMHPADHKESV